MLNCYETFKLFGFNESWPLEANDDETYIIQNPKHNNNIKS